jgi:hypothetical protein
MALCTECLPYVKRAPCTLCFAIQTGPSLVPTGLPFLPPSTNALVNGMAALMMPGPALSTPGPALCHTLKDALENLASALLQATAHVNHALLLVSPALQQQARSAGSSYDAAPPAALLQPTGSSNVAAAPAASVAGMEQARVAEGANVAAAIGATVGTEAAQLQAAPVHALNLLAQVSAVHAEQASQVALPLHAVLAAPRGGAGSGTAPTSIEGSRRANFPILTQGGSDKK